MNRLDAFLFGHSVVILAIAVVAVVAVFTVCQFYSHIIQ